jgi:hypothetical protein
VLKLLPDEHISPEVAKGVRRRNAQIKIHAMLEWDNGSLIGQDDAAGLRAAAAHGLTLVTYDCRTIPPLIKSWAEEGRSHAGVIFIDEKTISPADVGALVRALVEFHRLARRWDWTNRVCFLRR